MGTDRQHAQFYWPHGDACQPLHLVANAREESANLSISAFIEHHFELGRSLAGRFDSCSGEVRFAFRQIDAFAKLFEHIAGHLAGDLHVVHLLDTVPRMGELLRELAIVRHQDEAVTRHVKPTDAEKSAKVRRQEIGHARAAGGITRGADHAGWFVEREVDPPRLTQHFAIEQNLLLVGFDPYAELRDDLAVDHHPAFGDELFALAATGDSRGGKHFLEPLARLFRRAYRRRTGPARLGLTWRPCDGRLGLRRFVEFLAREAFGHEEFSSGARRESNLAG